MLLSELLTHATARRQATLMPAATPVPFMLTYEQLNHIIDDTDLTVDEWLQIACHGIILIPDEIEFPTGR